MANPCVSVLLSHRPTACKKAFIWHLLISFAQIDSCATDLSLLKKETCLELQSIRHHAFLLAAHNQPTQSINGIVVGVSLFIISNYLSH